jgi:hypothetical protein
MFRPDFGASGGHWGIFVTFFKKIRAAALIFMSISAKI